MTTRVASCQCGQLRATCTGEPTRVVVCSCSACQRRSGSPFGESAYFLQAQVTITGDARAYERTSDAGRWFRTHFCPVCGTSLFWHLEAAPEHVGVAVGAFADPAFPPPARAVWTQLQHGWIVLPAGVEAFPAMSPPPPRGNG